MAKRTTRAAASAPAGTPPEARQPAHAVTTLDAVVGQAQAKRAFESAMHAERVHHAWIFHGPAGVGKFTTAVAFGAALLDPRGAQPGTDIKRLIAGGNHPDLHVVNKELAAMSENPQVRDAKQITLPIGVIREFLIAPALKTRVLSPEGPTLASKVFIVDEAELMAAPAQNGVLKLLEEPPAGTVLILLTSSEDRLLPTIRSRCQRIGFSPLTDAEMEAWFDAHPGEAGLAPAQRAWVLRFAAGSPGAAAVAVRHGLFAWHERLGPMLDGLYGGEFPPELGSTLAALVSERAEAVVKETPEASKDAANKAWARRLLAYVADDARARLRQRAGKTGGKGGAALREDGAAARCLHVLDCVGEAERHLASNVNLAFVFDNLVAQAASEPAPM